MVAELPADTIATGIASSPDGMVVVGWHDKIPGVAAARPMILVGSDGRGWTEIDLADLVGPEDIVVLTGVVWTGTEYLVTTEGASLGESGVVWRSNDGRNWLRSILEPPQPEHAAVGRDAALIARRLTPELIQVDGDVGLTGIRQVGDSLVVVGWTQWPAIRAVVWQSLDATSWTSRFLPGDGEIAFGIETHAGATFVHGGGTGRGGAGYSVVWVDDDLADWRRVEYDIPDLEFLIGGAVGPGGRLVRITSYTESNATWWASTDGTRWSNTGATFDAVGVFGGRWVGVTCAGQTGEAAVASAPDVWEPAGDVDFCPRSVLHDGDEQVFQTAYGVMWRWSIPVWTTDDLPERADTPVFAVVNVAVDDTLNVRSGPGVDHPVIGRLAPSTSGVSLTGEETFVGTARWVEIVTPARTGWVNAYYLEEA